MKIIFTTYLYFISILVIGQTAFNPILNTKSDTAFKEGENKPFTGKYREHYPGDIKVKGQFINGLKEGEFIYYNNTIGSSDYGFCSMDSIINYKSGKKQGIQKGFFFCPQESYRKNYKNGLLDGNNYFWDLSCQLKTIDTYKNGVLIEHKDLPIDSTLKNIFIRVKGTKSDTLSRKQLSKLDTIKLEIVGYHYSTKDSYVSILKNYKLKSFEWIGSVKGYPDMMIKKSGNSFPERIKNAFNYSTTKRFWISNLIITDSYGIDYRLKDHKFIVIE